MKILSLFSGIGAFEKALKRNGINFELVNFCEFDKYAVKSYCAIHGESEDKNLGDITKVDEQTLPKDIDLITYGFPCQDISVAGKQKGMFNEDGTKTRSGLFFDALRIIEATKPKIAIAENVKNLTGKKFKEQFEIVLSSLNEAGYNNYWRVLNAKDFGIPQNRERVFIVSIRKDIDNGQFDFPKPFPLEKRLKDLLENEVDEKYYLSDEQVEKMQTTSYVSANFKNRVAETGGIVGTLCARDYKDPKCVQVGNLDIKGQDIVKRVYSSEGLSPTLTNMQGGNRQPKVVIEPYIAASRGRNDSTVGSKTIQKLEPNYQGLCNSLTTVQKDNYVVEPSALRMVRTEEGKQLRKQYENHEIKHGFNEHRVAELRDDGCSNTLSTVLKDNYIVEPNLKNERSGLKVKLVKRKKKND